MTIKRVASGEHLISAYTIPDKPDSPTDKEVGNFMLETGPNARIYASPLTNLKIVDSHYDGLLDIAKDIKKQEMKNPNAYGWHILNS